MAERLSHPGTIQRRMLRGNRDDLIQTAEGRPLRDRGHGPIGRQPAGNLVTPQIECEWFQRAEDGHHRQVQRMERARTMIVDDDNLTAGFDDAERFSQGLASNFFRLFVQQEEEQRSIVACAVELQRGTVAANQRCAVGVR